MTDIVNTFVFPIVRTDFILDALVSLELTTPPNYHVIVVDQTRQYGNVDHEHLSFEMKLREHCDLWLKTKKNCGFAQASNFGIRLAPTEYITVCNDDVVFINKDWWAGIMETFERYETAACVNPMSPREPGWGYGKPGFINHLTFEESIRPENILRLVEEKNNQVIDGITCWCTTFRADLLAEVGLFDENFWPGAGEDYDLMGRIYAKKYRALATSLSWVYHWWGKSKDEPGGLSQALPPARENWNHLSKLWPDGFDIWAKDPKTQKPLRRIPEIARMPL